MAEDTVTREKHHVSAVAVGLGTFEHSFRFIFGGCHPPCGCDVSQHRISVRTTRRRQRKTPKKPESGQ
jgi:hypothetical protein